LVNEDSKKNLKSAIVRLNDSLDVEFTICNFKYVEKVSHTNNWDKLKLAKEEPCEIFIYNRKKGKTLRYLKKAR
jgi:hypothetical protein